MHFRVVDVLGYKPQELLNEVCFDFFHPDDLEHMMESYQQGLNSSSILIHVGGLMLLLNILE